MTTRTAPTTMVEAALTTIPTTEHTERGGMTMRGTR
jgi:hypothetical protein